MSEEENGMNEQIELDDQTCAQLKLFATELAEDYSKYLKVDCFQEVMLFLRSELDLKVYFRVGNCRIRLMIISGY